MEVTSAVVGNFEKPELPIADPSRFSAVRNAIEAAFSSAKLEGFLKSMSRAGIRIRNFEATLGQGLLGNTTRSDYAALGNADQGQIREFYLATLERIPAELRQKFFRLYAYY